jgi:hypothetical protein
MSLNILTTLQDAVNANYTLTIQDKKLLQAMMNNNPNCFDDIDATISDIIQDGKVDIHDIPKIVLLVSQLFQLHFNVKNVDMTSIVKFVVHVILEILPIPHIEVSIAEKLADTSIDLLATNLNYIEHSIENIASSSCCRPKIKKS